MKLTLFPALALLALSLVFPGAHSAPQDTPKHIDVVARRFEFVPADITVKRGIPVTIALTSKDVDHGLKFKDLNFTINAKKGKTTELTFTPEKVGAFIGQCSVFCGSGHGAMKMTIHVTE